MCMCMCMHVLACVCACTYVHVYVHVRVCMCMCMLRPPQLLLLPPLLPLSVLRQLLLAIFRDWLTSRLAWNSLRFPAHLGARSYPLRLQMHWIYWPSMLVTCLHACQTRCERPQCRHDLCWLMGMTRVCALTHTPTLRLRNVTIWYDVSCYQTAGV